MMWKLSTIIDMCKRRDFEAMPLSFPFKLMAPLILMYATHEAYETPRTKSLRDFDDNLSCSPGAIKSLYSLVDLGDFLQAYYLAADADALNDPVVAGIISNYVKTHAAVLAPFLEQGDVPAYAGCDWEACHSCNYVHFLTLAIVFGGPALAPAAVVWVGLWAYVRWPLIRPRWGHVRSAMFWVCDRIIINAYDEPYRVSSVAALSDRRRSRWGFLARHQEPRMSANVVTRRRRKGKGEAQSTYCGLDVAPLRSWYDSKVRVAYVCVCVCVISVDIAADSRIGRSDRRGPRAPDHVARLRTGRRPRAMFRTTCG
jgi:hypothetical protein